MRKQTVFQSDDEDERNSSALSRRARHQFTGTSALYWSVSATRAEWSIKSRKPSAPARHKSTAALTSSCKFSRRASASSLFSAFKAFS